MSILLDSLRVPASLCLFSLRMFSFLAGVGTLGGFLMQQSLSRVICFVVLPVTAFVCHMLAVKLAGMLSQTDMR